MKKERLYLDTSVPSAYYDMRSGVIQHETVYLFEKKLKNYKVYISEITIGELSRTDEPLRRTQLLTLIKDLTILPITEESEKLADLYVKNRIIPLKYREDALHVAIASLGEMDLLVSWNFEHLVKHKTRKMVNEVNILEGHKPIDIVSPQEL
ncbi:MAG: type II toxin-antitoxin system VapC family toxin [Candidatus Scalinduaceae bacterium]